MVFFVVFFFSILSWLACQKVDAKALTRALAKRVYDPNFATFWVISTLIFLLTVLDVFFFLVYFVLGG